MQRGITIPRNRRGRALIWMHGEEGEVWVMLHMHPRNPVPSLQQATAAFYELCLQLSFFGGRLRSIETDVAQVIVEGMLPTICTMEWVFTEKPLLLRKGRRPYRKVHELTLTSPVLPEPNELARMLGAPDVQALFFLPDMRERLQAYLALRALV